MTDTIDLDALTAEFIVLRDKKSELSSTFKAAEATLKERMDSIKFK